MNAGLRKGMRYEDRARRYLESRGLSLLAQNYRCRTGELDLVMRDGDRICFIEVKYRRSATFGGAAQSIPRAKRQKLVSTALRYLSSEPNIARLAPRFDAVLIQGRADGGEDIEWIANAFYAEG